MERDAQSFYSGFSIAHKFVSPQRAPKVAPTRSVCSLNSTNFLQNSPNPPRASGAWRHLHSLAPFPIWAIVTSLSDTSTQRARVNTRVNVAPK